MGELLNPDILPTVISHLAITDRISFAKVNHTAAIYESLPSSWNNVTKLTVSGDGYNFWLNKDKKSYLCRLGKALTTIFKKCPNITHLRYLSSDNTFYTIVNKIRTPKLKSLLISGLNRGLIIRECLPLIHQNKDTLTCLKFDYLELCNYEQSLLANISTCQNLKTLKYTRVEFLRNTFNPNTIKLTLQNLKQLTRLHLRDIEYTTPQMIDLLKVVPLTGITTSWNKFDILEFLDRAPNKTIARIKYFSYTWLYKLDYTEKYNLLFNIITGFPSLKRLYCIRIDLTVEQVIEIIEVFLAVLSTRTDETWVANPMFHLTFTYTSVVCTPKYIDTLETYLSKYFTFRIRNRYYQISNETMTLKLKILNTWYPTW